MRYPQDTRGNHTAVVYTGTSPNRAAPAGNRGLTTATVEESEVAASQHTHTPRLHLDRDVRAHCGDISPSMRRCNRRPGHTGRHLFWWRHLDGRVREVW